MGRSRDDRACGQRPILSRAVLGALIGFSLAFNVMLLAAPGYMLQVYDRVLPSRATETLVLLTVLAAGVLIAAGLLDLVRSRLLVRIGNAVTERGTAAALVPVEGAASPGDALDDVRALRAFFHGRTPAALLDVPWVPAFLALVFLVHPWLGAAACVGAVVLVGLAALGELVTRRRQADTAAAEGRARTTFDALLRNREVVAAMGLGVAARGRWLGEQRAALALQSRVADRVAGLVAAAKSVRLLLQVALLGLGALLVLAEKITPGAMIAASILSTRALAPVEQAVGGWRAIAAARRAWARLGARLAVLDAAPVTMDIGRPEGALAVSGLWVGPPGAERAAIEDVDFTVAPGEVLGVVGASGSGKTTLARALVGVWAAQRGSVRIGGAEVGALAEATRRVTIGYLPQEPSLFDGTVAENVAGFDEPDPHAVMTAARLADAHEMILGLERGYDTRIGPHGERLSAGQRQRLALARALYREPALVVLDEPNANLDADGETALARAVATLKRRGAAVVVMTHRAGILRACDRVMAFDGGRLAPYATRVAPVARTPLAMREAS
jgi:PrtD family type I secretion system ABC transporter